MSRVGNTPVAVVKDVTVDVKGTDVEVKGPKGTLTFPVPYGISVSVEDGKVAVSRNGNSKKMRAMHGTTRALISNMIDGVVTGYKKVLFLEGVGFRAQPKGKGITLALGYSHPIDFVPPEGVDIKLPNEATIEITGIDKQKVGQAAAQIRSYYKVEPYKGKGVRYSDETVRRKVGKAVT